MTAKGKHSSRSAKAQQRSRFLDGEILDFSEAGAMPASGAPRLKPQSRAAVVREAIAATIRKVPRGKVSTYGAIARAAGFPRGARLTARVLGRSFDLPWQRILGAGGEIKLRGDSAVEQRLRLEAEGVTFRGRRVNMKAHEFKFTRARGDQSAIASRASAQRKLRRR